MDILDKLLFNLNTIANIPKNSRISTSREFIVIDNESLLQPIMRWRDNDTRDKSVEVIKREVKTTIKMASYIMESKWLFVDNEDNEDTNNGNNSDHSDNANDNIRNERIAELKKIRKALKNSKIGINNLCITYICDANIIAGLKPIIVEIDQCFNNITSLLIELGEINT